MFRWRVPRLFRAVIASVLMLCLLPLAALAQVEWDLLRDGEPAGKVPVQSRSGRSLVSLDVTSSHLGLSMEEKGDNLFIRGPGGQVQVFPGAAAAMYKGEIIPFAHEVIRSEGHWWVDPECAVTLAARAGGADIGALSWRGEGYRPQYAPSPLAPQPTVTPVPRPSPSPTLPLTGSASIRSIRWGRQDFGIRVVLDLSDPVSVLVEPTQGKVTVTVPGLMARGTPGSSFPYPSEVGLSVTQFGDRVTLVFNHNASSVRHFALEAPFRQVLDFYSPMPLGSYPVPYLPPGIDEAEEAASEATTPEVTASEEEYVPLPPVSHLPEKTSRGVKTVVLDPGHGGRDPGAVANGIREKDINLRVARLMADILKKKGLRVVMTRSTDVYLPLSQRTNIAVKEDADVFVSLHCNALPKGRTAQGVEIYLMALPSDKHAMELALIENRELAEGGLESSEASDKRTQTLLKILGDMQQNLKIEESTTVAEVLFRTGQSRKLPMRRVAQAPFYVLRGAAMPSVLVEMGFITNSAEAAKLRNPKYQQQMAEALSAGIVEFLKKSDYN